MDHSRRDFSKLTVLGAAGMCVTGCAGGAPKGTATLTDSGMRVVLADNPALAPAQGSTAIDAGGAKLLVVNRGQGEYLVIDRKCTHAGCSVRWEGQARQVACPCHGSRFSVDGAVDKGPAKKPLRVYTNAIVDGVLLVSLKL